MNSDPDLYVEQQRVEPGEIGPFRYYYLPEPGDWVTPIVNATGDEWRIEFRNRYAPFWPTEMERPLWPVSMEDPFWPRELSWRPMRSLRRSRTSSGLRAWAARP